MTELKNPAEILFFHAILKSNYKNKSLWGTDSSWVQIRAFRVTDGNKQVRQLDDGLCARHYRCCNYWPMLMRLLWQIKRRKQSYLEWLFSQLLISRISVIQQQDLVSWQILNLYRLVFSLSVPLLPALPFLLLLSQYACLLQLWCFW